MHLGMPECHKQFLGHCDLDLWPSFKNYCVQSISPILFDVGIPNFGWWFLLGWRSGAYHFESLWPWHWLLASFLGFLCYITANFPQMCLMLDQFLWGHSSHVCDISCFAFKTDLLSWWAWSHLIKNKMISRLMCRSLIFLPNVWAEIKSKTYSEANCCQAWQPSVKKSLE